QDRVSLLRTRFELPVSRFHTSKTASSRSREVPLFQGCDFSTLTGLEKGCKKVQRLRFCQGNEYPTSGFSEVKSWRKRRSSSLTHGARLITTGGFGSRSDKRSQRERPPTAKRASPDISRH